MAHDTLWCIGTTDLTLCKVINHCRSSSSDGNEKSLSNTAYNAHLSHSRFEAENYILDDPHREKIVESHDKEQTLKMICNRPIINRFFQ